MKRRKKKKSSLYLCVSLNFQRSYYPEREQGGFIFLPLQAATWTSKVSGPWVVVRGNMSRDKTRLGSSKECRVLPGIGLFWRWLSGQEEEELTVVAQKPEALRHLEWNWQNHFVYGERDALFTFEMLAAWWRGSHTVWHHPSNKHNSHQFFPVQV